MHPPLLGPSTDQTEAEAEAEVEVEAEAVVVVAVVEHRIVSRLQVAMMCAHMTSPWAKLYKWKGRSRDTVLVERVLEPLVVVPRVQAKTETVGAWLAAVRFSSFEGA